MRFPRHGESLRSRLDAAAIGRDDDPSPGWPAFPGYEILRELGRGGMGVVYEARQSAPDRIVALKTILPGHDVAGEGIDRFRREAEAIARLDHPHIVPIYEVGESGGRPYYGMKFYPGGSLARASRGRGTDLHAHARMVETIARAVHHAHGRGILHRDLKPANILLDEAGQPHVADFGLARWIGAGATTPGLGFVGTPSYTAPEWASGGPAGDVYGLGAILYELITGVPPFRADTALGTLRQVVEDPPRRPSLHHPRLPADLETICLKCLEKEPSRRYADALELAEELRRWRDGEVIRARPASAVQRAWRWTRRHPVVATLSIMTAAALLLAVVTLAVSRARIAAEHAETARVLDDERQALRRGQELLYLERVASAARLWAGNQLAPASRLLDDCPPAFRDWEWHFLDTIRRPYRESWEPEDRVTAVSYGPGGRFLARVDAGGIVRLLDAAGRPLPVSFRHGGFVTGLAVHPDGSQIATADGATVKTWDIATGEERLRLPGRYWVAYSPDGQLLGSSDGDTIRVWEARTGREQSRSRAAVQLVRHGVFSPDGRHFATGGFAGWEASDPRADAGVVQLWEVRAGQAVGEPRRYDRPVHSLAYTPDGRHLLIGQATGILCTASATGEVERRIEGAVSQLPRPAGRRPGRAVPRLRRRRSHDPDLGPPALEGGAHPARAFGRRVRAGLPSGWTDARIGRPGLFREDLGHGWAG